MGKQIKTDKKAKAKQEPVAEKEAESITVEQKKLTD